MLLLRQGVPHGVSESGQPVVSTQALAFRNQLEV